jgi:hypothetical protein
MRLRSHATSGSGGRGAGGRNGSSGSFSRVLERNSQQRRRRDEHPAGVGAAVRELAMRAIDDRPLVDELEDRLLLPSEDPVYRVGDRTTVGQAAGLAQLGAPAMRAHVGEPEYPACAGMRPAGAGRVVDEAQQLELDLRAHTSGDRAEKPERCLPRCSAMELPRFGGVRLLLS